LIKRRRFPKIYFGWWLTVVTSIIGALSGTFYMYGISVLFKPIASELGLSRAVASMAVGIGALCNGLMFAIMGWLSDRFGPKWVIIASAFATGIGFVLMNFITSAWTYYIVWGVIITAGHSGFALPIDLMLTNWFVKKRGLAFSLRFTIVGIIAVIVLPVVSLLIASHGWRMTCLIWAVMTFATIPPLFYFVKQRRPEYYGLLPDGAKVDSDSEAGVDATIAKGVEYAAGYQEQEFTLRQAMKTSSYWILLVAWILHGIVFRGFTVHCVPFLTDIGIDPIVAGSMMAMMIFFNIPSRFFGGIIADRVRKEHLKFLLAGTLLFIAVGITVFLLNQTLAMVYIFLILFGFGQGAYVPLDTLIRGRYFGRKAYGSIQGSTQIISAPISFLAPVYVGWVYDVSGSYISAFTVFVAIAAFAVFILCLMRAPKPPAQVSDIRQFM